MTQEETIFCDDMAQFQSLNSLDIDPALLADLPPADRAFFQIRRTLSACSEMTTWVKYDADFFLQADFAGSLLASLASLWFISHNVHHKGDRVIFNQSSLGILDNFPIHVGFVTPLVLLGIEEARDFFRGVIRRLLHRDHPETCSYLAKPGTRITSPIGPIATKEVC